MKFLSIVYAFITASVCNAKLGAITKNELLEVSFIKLVLNLIIQLNYIHQYIGDEKA